MDISICTIIMNDEKLVASTDIETAKYFVNSKSLLSLLLSTVRSHPCSVELSYGNVYCFECGDYVYHNDLESISEAAFDKYVNDT